MIGRGLKDYWTNKWNYIDFFVLIVMIFDMGISFVPCDTKSSLRTQGVNNLLKGLRMFRLIRCIRLLKVGSSFVQCRFCPNSIAKINLMSSTQPLIPAIISYLNGRVNKQLFLGYDIILGYIQAIDDVLKYLPNMVDNPRVMRKLRASLDTEHLTAVRETGECALKGTKSVDNYLIIVQSFNRTFIKRTPWNCHCSKNASCQSLCP